MPPIVLCYFEGLTHDEAAGSLDWPVGTVRGRLARARERLRLRLIRRGLAPAIAAALATGESTSAGLTVPPALADAVVRSATGTPAPATVVMLADAMLRGFLVGGVRRSLVILMIALAVGGGLAAVGKVSGQAPGDALKSSSPVASQPAADRTGFRTVRSSRRSATIRRRRADGIGAVQPR